MQASVHAVEATALSDAAAVLEQYVSFHRNEEQQAGCIRDHLLSNSVLDWFGRSVRGAHKIAEFCKYEIAEQYEHTHNFHKPVECEPIELRAVHMSTKRILARDVDYINPRNKVNANSLKPYADSDSDSDNDIDEAANEELMPLVVVPGNKTPERADGELLLAPLTPPTSKTKPNFDASSTETDDDNEDDFMEVRAKRMKRTHPTSASATTTTTTSNNYLQRNDEHIDVAAAAATIESEYSNLRYLEVLGVLRKRLHDRHNYKADTKSETTLAASAACSAAAAAATPDDADDDNATSTGCWDRTIRIRISYRTRLTDHHVYYALIIYEHADDKLRPALQKPLRRNLLTEFTQKVNAHNELLADDDTETETIDVERANVTSSTAASELMPTPNHNDTHTHTQLPGMELMVSGDTSMTMLNDALRTPTKLAHTPPATPKRKPRPHFAAVSGMKRLHVSPTTPKRSAARSLRL